jgi:enamine deaminase RidA (YjgF/YER057c/UK114 family)
MTHQEIAIPGLRPPAGHYVNVVEAPLKGRMVFISGMTAQKEDGTVDGIGDIHAQTRRVCQKLQLAVEAAGGAMTDICRVDVYVTDVGDFAAIHEVRREFFSDPLPVSTMVQIVGLVNPDYLIEISAIAIVD